MNERQHEQARRSANALADAVGGGQDAEMPGKPFQSKLNPHLDEIRALRRGRKTWQEIAATITARHGIKTNASSVYEFARRRANRPAPFGFDEPALEPASAAKSDKSPQAAQAAEDPWRVKVHTPKPRTPAAAADPREERPFVYDPADNLIPEKPTKETKK